MHSLKFVFCKNAHLGRTWVPETQWVARYAGGLQLPFIAVAQTLWYCGPPYLPFRTHGLSRLFFVNNGNKEVKLSKVFGLIGIRLIDGCIYMGGKGSEKWLSWSKIIMVLAKSSIFWNVVPWIRRWHWLHIQCKTK